MVPVWAPVTLAPSILGISGKVSTGLWRRAELGDGAREWVGKAWSGTGAGTGGSFKVALLARMLGLLCVCVYIYSMSICNVMIAWPSVLTCPCQDLRNGLWALVHSPSTLCVVVRCWAWEALRGGSILGANSSPAPSCRLLVGAPQALALPGQQANRTGGLFACPLSVEETDCYRVDIDQGGMGPVGVEWR